MPPRDVTYAIRVPSGDQRADRPPYRRSEMRRAAPLSVGTSHRSLDRALAARSGVITVYTTH